MTEPSQGSTAIDIDCPRCLVLRGCYCIEMKYTGVLVGRYHKERVAAAGALTKAINVAARSNPNEGDQ
jgi:hypothetical protein